MSGGVPNVVTARRYVIRVFLLNYLTHRYSIQYTLHYVISQQGGGRMAAGWSAPPTHVADAAERRGGRAVRLAAKRGHGHGGLSRYSATNFKLALT